MRADDTIGALRDRLAAAEAARAAQADAIRKSIAARPSAVDPRLIGVSPDISGFTPKATTGGISSAANKLVEGVAARYNKSLNMPRIPNVGKFAPGAALVRGAGALQSGVGAYGLATDPIGINTDTARNLTDVAFGAATVYNPAAGIALNTGKELGELGAYGAYKAGAFDSIPGVKENPIATPEAMKISPKRIEELRAMQQRGEFDQTRQKNALDFVAGLPEYTPKTTQAADKTQGGIAHASPRIKGVESLPGKNTPGVFSGASQHTYKPDGTPGDLNAGPNGEYYYSPEDARRAAAKQSLEMAISPARDTRTGAYDADMVKALMPGYGHVVDLEGTIYGANEATNRQGMSDAASLRREEINQVGLNARHDSGASRIMNMRANLMQKIMRGEATPGETALFNDISGIGSKTDRYPDLVKLYGSMTQDQDSTPKEKAAVRELVMEKSGMTRAPSVSQSDLEYTAKKHNMTVEQVKSKLGLNNAN